MVIRVIFVKSLVMGTSQSAQPKKDDKTHNILPFLLTDNVCKE
jgi:hypothetical protein